MINFVTIYLYLVNVHQWWFGKTDGRELISKVCEGTNFILLFFLIRFVCIHTRLKETNYAHMWAKIVRSFRTGCFADARCCRFFDPTKTRNLFHPWRWHLSLDWVLGNLKTLFQLRMLFMQSLCKVKSFLRKPKFDSSFVEKADVVYQPDSIRCWLQRPYLIEIH